MRSAESREDRKTTLYLRLPKDDEGVSESASITGQHSILLKYAKVHNLTELREYVDATNIIKQTQTPHCRAPI